MDTNLMSCPKCGHSVSSAAGVCAYCGAVISKGEPNRQPDEKISGAEEDARSSELAPPLQPESYPPGIEMPEDPGSEPAVPSGAQSPEPLTEATPGKTEEEIVIELSEQVRIVNAKPDISDPAGDKPAESETRVAEISERVEVVTPPVPQMASPLDQAVAEPQTGLVQDTPPVGVEDTTVEPAAEVKPEVSEETILLTLPADVQSPLKDLPDSVEENAQVETAGGIAETAAWSNGTEAKPDVSPPQDKAQDRSEAIQKQAAAQSSAETLKIEKAAREMADALKNQKAAMAKVKALKKQKLKTAQAQALKRKKAALARAQAVKKQKDAQAGIEISKKEETAATMPNTADSHRMVMRGLEAKTKMLGLLKKYQGQAIGINYDNSVEIKEAKLIEANDEFFCVFVKDKELHYSYPLRTILTVIEGKDGVDVSNPEQKETFNVVVKVYPFVAF